jgi:hypothetical protein
MGYKARGLVFSGQWFADREVAGSWVHGDLVARALLAPLERGDYLARADQISINLAAHEPIGGPDRLRALAATWRHDIISLIHGDAGDPDWHLHLGLDAMGPRIFVGIAAEHVTPHVREDVAAWVAAWSRGLAEARVRLAHGRFEPTPDGHARAFPPRDSPIWTLGSLDQYDGLAWHRADPGRTAVIERLLEAPLPSGVQRTIDGDVVRIAFDCDLASRESMAVARSAHERWLTPLVPTTVARGWNEHGDRRVAPLAPVARPPFTLYDPSNRVGYKALVVHPGGVIDEIAWSQLRAIAAARALHDGTPVAAVRIVFPRREDALRFHARAIAEGFEMAMYPDRGAFWEVHPAIDHPSLTSV